jgi:thymidine kinase
MYAGKSEELIRRARRALYAKRKVQVFKPRIDIRFDEQMVVSHMGIRHEALPVATVSELEKSIDKDTHMVCIEEVQFFDDSIVDLCVRLADKGREVVCAGLDQDFARRPFGPIPLLLCAADEVIKLRAICMHCGRAASHTYRSIEGKPARADDPLILIGATESYEARCRACHQVPGLKKQGKRKSK